MSDLPGNPHEGAFNFALGAAPKSDEDRLNLDAMATVQATLALAYEQRTANLIGVLEHLGGTNQLIWQEIYDRLGLGENK